MACKILPHSDFAFGFGFLTFVFVLFFWQRIRDVVLTPQLLFLDKLCIPQHDEKLKEQCILGLAGYLKASDKLVILWSERYFLRLWCCYEIAAFLRANPQLEAVQVMPVMLPLLLLVHCAWWFFCRVCLHLLWFTVIGTAEARTMIVAVVLSSAFLVTFPLQSRAGAHLSQNLGKLTAQLGQFNIHRTQCSCCTNNHRHPRTGEALRCWPAVKEVKFRYHNGYIYI